MTQRQRQVLVLLAAGLVLMAVWWARSGGDPVEPDRGSGSATDAASGFAWVDEADLPGEARDVLRRIDRGGPFKYPEHDGKTFKNFEGLLPDRERGHYTEYTVETRPGVRGPLRIVAGGDGELFWTEDHYESFTRIRR